MVLAYAVFDLHLPGCRGLKEKRMIVKSLKSRIRREFEISAAEVGNQDLLQRSTLGVAAIGPDQVPLDQLLQSVLRFVESNLEGEIVLLTNPRLAGNVTCLPPLHAGEATAVKSPASIAAVGTKAIFCGGLDF